jgi:hypothetical protein
MKFRTTRALGGERTDWRRSRSVPRRSRRPQKSARQKRARSAELATTPPAAEPTPSTLSARVTSCHRPSRTRHSAAVRPGPRGSPRPSAPADRVVICATGYRRPLEPLVDHLGCSTSAACPRRSASSRRPRGQLRAAPGRARLYGKEARRAAKAIAHELRSGDGSRPRRVAGLLRRPPSRTRRRRSARARRAVEHGRFHGVVQAVDHLGLVVPALASVRSDLPAEEAHGGHAGDLAEGSGEHALAEP